MPLPDSIAIIDAYWARRSNCDEQEFASTDTFIHEYPADASHRFNVIAARRTAGGCVINVHDNVYGPIAHFAGFPADEVFQRERLEQAYAEGTIKLTLLPAQAYADATDMRDPGTSHHVRTIDSLDDPAFIRLREACAPADWLEGSLPEAKPPLFATFIDGEIAAVAHGIAEGRVRKTGIVTHPDHRGQGHARAAAFAMARHWIAEGAVMEWQARRMNKASLAVRDALGFVERYSMIMLRVEL